MTNLNQKLQISLMILAVSLMSPLWADTPQEDGSSPGVGSHGHSDLHFHANEIAVFVGATTPTKAKSETSFTIGADYERRFHEWFGAGALVDFAFGELKRTALAGPAFFIHPGGAFRFVLGPAAEWVEEDAPMSQRAGTKHEPHFVMRAGLNYSFHAGRMLISPVFNVDFIGETKTSLVYGVAFGVGF